MFQHNEVAHILANFGESSWQQSSVSGIGLNQSVYLLSIGKKGFTRAHGFPPEATQLSFWRQSKLAGPVPDRSRQARHEYSIRPATRGWNKNPDRRLGSTGATPPRADLQ